jgi:uncharacterized protein YndB with AHSA1/START domain
MKQTIFTPDNTGNKMLVEREFDAGLEQVWQAWTDSILLAEWWAPHPFKAITKLMDFKEGGQWHYYMLGPDESKFWCMVNYLQIQLLKCFTAEIFFCDEQGNNTNELPGMHWENVFTSTATGTRVNVIITYKSKEDMEKIISMGFKEGFAAAHNNLDALLKK